MTHSSKPNNKSISYKDAGVDIAAGNALVDAIKPLAKATNRLGANNALGGFGGLFDLKACGFDDPVLVAANDGVGTKLRVALDCNIHDTVGIDLVAMSVNDLVVQGAEPLFFLDYFATGKLDVTVAKEVIAGIATGCLDAGCALIGGETAEMPGMYHGDDYDLAGFAVGAVERDQILPKNTIAKGDVILGLKSSGPHSNGYSLIRKLVEGLDYNQPAPFQPDITLGTALLTPTRIYVKAILACLQQKLPIKALAHITGGGITENLPRVLQQDVAAKIKLDEIDVPAVFSFLQQRGSMSEAEMLRTFNCGIGMMVVIGEEFADQTMAVLAENGETVCRIGEIVTRPNNAEQVQYSGTLQLGHSKLGDGA